MISAWWLVGALIIGAVIGIVTMCLMMVSKDG